MTTVLSRRVLCIQMHKRVNSVQLSSSAGSLSAVEVGGNVLLRSLPPSPRLFVACPSASSILSHSALRQGDLGRTGRAPLARMEVLADDEKIELLLTAIDEQESTLSTLLEKVTALVRALNQPKPIDPLVELEVCLDITRSHMTHVRESRIRKKLGLVAVGGYWSLVR